MNMNTSSFPNSALLTIILQGIIGLETEHGTLHIKLHPDCAPYSVAYILELLQLRHCAGCHFHRVEGRGASWDSKGNHLQDRLDLNSQAGVSSALTSLPPETEGSYGPPFALLQGTLGAQGIEFNKMPTEFCLKVKRGPVAWVRPGLEFVVSLANHNEWKQAYTVFGSVLPEDMEIVGRIAELPTEPDIWSNVNVSVLQKPVALLLKRIQIGDMEVTQRI